MKRVLSIVALLMLTVGTLVAQTVNIAKQPNADAGSVDYDITEGVCTLTVVPADGYYANLECISVELTVNGSVAQAPRRSLDIYTVDVTALSSDADPSGTTQYSFVIPDNNYTAEVSVDFQTRKSISDAVITLAETSYTYDGTEKKPSVSSVVLGETTLGDGDYEVSYSDNVNAGESAAVTVTGLRTYMGTATATFTIKKATITEALIKKPAGINNLIYNDDDQNLVTAGEVPTGATVKYYCQYFTFEEYGEGSSDLSCDANAENYEYSTDVPKGKDAGVYGILYLVDGGDNYNDIPATSTIWVSIAPATVTSVDIDVEVLTYNTLAQTPTITSVKAGNLELGTDDYTVSYEKITGKETTTEIEASDVKAVGSYNVVVTGQGNFTGTAIAPFDIVNRALADGEVTFHNHWATFYNAVGDVDLTGDIGAFIVLESGIGENTVTVTQIKNVPQGVPVLLNDQTTGTTENTSVAGNMLRHADKNLEIYDSSSYYGLYNGTFMRVKGTIPADRNYLLIDMPQAPQLTIVFDGESTGVKGVKEVREGKDNNFYTLDGRKVQKPSKKGLYINEGHKVVVK